MSVPLGAFCDGVGGDLIVQRGRTDERVALLGAEVRHIDQRRGICSDQAQGLTGDRACEGFAQAQDGQGAKQVAGVNVLHGHEIGAGRARVYCYLARECDWMPRDGDARAA